MNDQALPVVVLAGNPNSGKTTLFNQLTGLRQRVGNYPGVTIEKKWGPTRLGDKDVIVVDLPGTYSLVSRSRDEAIAFEVITGRTKDLFPDVNVVVLDASNLSRNLYLALQVLELGRPTVLVLNMMDLARTNGLEIDAKVLEAELGVPVVPIVASSGEGIDTLRARVREVLEQAPSPTLRRFRLSDEAEEELLELTTKLPVANGTATEQERQAQVLWALSTLAVAKDAATLGTREDPFFGQPDLVSLIDALRPVLAARPSLPAEAVSARYEIAHALSDKATARSARLGPSWTDRVDAVLLHAFFGPLVLLLTLGIVFQSIFAWAEPLMDLVEGSFGAIGGAVATVLPEGLLSSLIVDGVIAGVGSVLVFVPQIAILFFFLAMLEDSGYLARAAYMMDRLMAKVGLHGKAFVPLISGFACAIPAIMSTRTIESWRDRLVTILVTPLMSCSARLPVYALIISALFSKVPKVGGFLSVGALLLLAMYALSIFFAITMAAIFKRTLLKSPTPPLVLELPPYRMPRLGSAVRRMVERSMVFVRDAGTMILACSIVLWGLLSYPQHPKLDFAPATERAAIERELPEGEARAAKISALDARVESERLQQSYAGRLGHFIEPVIAPLGYDWKIGIGLIASFAAREVLVSTLGMIYGIGKDADEESAGLREALRDARDPNTGQPIYTPLVGLSLMIFFLLACQCMSTLAVVRRETASWRWPVFMFSYMTVLAWFGAFAVYQGGRLFGLS